MANEMVLYDSSYLSLFDGTHVWADITNVAAVLLAAAYTPDTAAHTDYSDVSANEVDDAVQTDYAPVAVTGRSVSLTSDEIRYTCSKIDFGSTVSLEGQYIGIIAGDAASLNATDKLLGYIDLGEAKSSTNAEFSFTPAATGLYRIQKAA